MNILDTIIARKQVEVAEAKALVSVAKLEAMPLFAQPTLSLQQFLLDESKTSIIAEYKRKSPSKGIINDRSLVTDVTKGYSDLGASAISVLTDADFFGGSLSHLQAASQVVSVPLLRKEFVIDEYQILEAKAYGASVILLIAACLSPQRVQQLAGFANRLGLEVLLEIHNHDELAHICDEISCVGVNNRNLKTFEVDIQTSLQLVTAILAHQKIPIAESGISNTDTIVTLRNAGFKGFLIGENFMKQADPTIAFAEFVADLKSKYA